MKTYQVEIRETFCMTVEIEAENTPASRSDGAGSIQQ